MKEKDYIDISNRVKIQTAQTLLRDVLIMDGEKIIKRDDMRKVLYKLNEWSDKFVVKIDRR